MYRDVVDGKLRCRDCKDWFLVGTFQHFTGRDGKSRPGSYCQNCKRGRTKKDAAKCRYGLTGNEFNELVKKYPVCAICGSDQVFIDHNHSTGAVRGRLCRKCNTGIGMFLESPALLESAKKYLTSF